MIEYEYDIRSRRRHEFPSTILELAINNVVIAYAHGHIHTKEEALCIMVSQLAKDWDEQKRRNYEFAMHYGAMVSHEKGAQRE